MFASMRARPLIRGALALGAVFTASAWAQVPLSSLQLTFVQPTGTVLATDSIDIVLRLTNTDTTTFTLDNSLPNLGLVAADLPTTGEGTDANGASIPNDSFVSYVAANFGLGYGCSGTFNACGPSPYDFNFSSDSFPAPFKLAAGEHYDYVLGTYTPVGGVAPAGSYEFYRGALAFFVYGTDADGNSVSSLSFPTQTCDVDSAVDCIADGKTIFTRTVLAVPEPQTYALMALGLCAIGVHLRRRRR